MARHGQAQSSLRHPDIGHQQAESQHAVPFDNGLDVEQRMPPICQVGAIAQGKQVTHYPGTNFTNRKGRCLGDIAVVGQRILCARGCAPSSDRDRLQPAELLCGQSFNTSPPILNRNILHNMLYNHTIASYVATGGVHLGPEEVSIPPTYQHE